MLENIKFRIRRELNPRPTRVNYIALAAKPLGQQTESAD